MVYKKAVKRWSKYYTRKDRRAEFVGNPYSSYFHYSSGSRIKGIRKEANQKLRRYNGEVGNNGWYKKFEEVWWIVY